MNWRERLRTQGYAHFAGLTPEPLVTAALKAIKMDLGRNYDPSRQVEYDNQSYCPDLRGTSPIMSLLVNSPSLNILDEAIGLDNLDWDKGQMQFAERIITLSLLRHSLILTGLQVE